MEVPIEEKKDFHILLDFCQIDIKTKKAIKNMSIVELELFSSIMINASTYIRDTHQINKTERTEDQLKMVCYLSEILILVSKNLINVTNSYREYYI